MENSKLYKFLKENENLKIAIQSVDTVNTNRRGILIQVFDTDNYHHTPIFNHYMDYDFMERVSVDFETIIMTPVINWWNSEKEKRGDLHG